MSFCLVVRAGGTEARIAQQEVQKRKKQLNAAFLDFLIYLAVRGGFEPPIRDDRIHAFQACSFSHSDISPHIFFYVVPVLGTVLII